MRPAPKTTLSANLDLLRAVAVLCVFSSHLASALGNDEFGSLGRFGVILFFVHTSLVLMASLERMQGPATDDLRLTLAFWSRRVFRIYPMAILFVLLVTVCRIPPEPGSRYVWIGLRAFLSNLALTQNLTHAPYTLSVLWSLPLEVQMYVLLPGLYFALRGGRHRSLGLWVLSVAMAMTIPRLSDQLNVFRYGPCFVAGVVAFDLARSRQWKWKLPAWMWLVGVGVAIALFGPHDNISMMAKIHRAWMLSLLLGVLYPNVEEAAKGAWLKVPHWIAEHSYGIYLSHSIVIWLALDVMAGTSLGMRVLMLVAGSIGIPAMLYVFFERPLMRTGGQIARRLMARPATVNESRVA
jgi:peptidoglycan/LPS O-acetylase OafA/YrhL